MTEEKSCKNCEYGSYLITFDDGTYLEENGKPIMLCSTPEEHLFFKSDDCTGWKPKD